MTRLRATIGLDIGGTKISGCVIDSNGLVLARGRKDTPAQDPGAIVSESADLIRELSRIRSADSLTMAPGSWAGVSLRPLARTSPFESMTQPLILVPPMSRPIVALKRVILRPRHPPECPGPWGHRKATRNLTRGLSPSRMPS